MKTLIASLLLVVGCASSGVRVNDEPQLVTVLTVTNQRPEDAAIYVMRNGIRGRRLGGVTSFGSATFILNASDAPVASDVQFLARTFITGAMELSDPIPAARGAIYEWKLAPAAGHAFLAIRYANR